MPDYGIAMPDSGIVMPDSGIAMPDSGILILLVWNWRLTTKYTEQESSSRAREFHQETYFSVLSRGLTNMSEYRTKCIAIVFAQILALELGECLSQSNIYVCV